MNNRKSATLSHLFTHMMQSEQLTLQGELEVLEVEMEGYLEELGYGA